MYSPSRSPLPPPSHVSFQMMFSSGSMSRSCIAGSYVSSVFSFLRNPCTVLPSDCTSLHCHYLCRRAPFSSHSLQQFIICRLFHNGHSDWCEVMPHCSFDLQLSIFSYAILPSMCLLWRNSYLDVLPSF